MCSSTWSGLYHREKEIYIAYLTFHHQSPFEKLQLQAASTLRLLMIQGTTYNTYLSVNEFGENTSDFRSTDCRQNGLGHYGIKHLFKFFFFFKFCTQSSNELIDNFLMNSYQIIYIFPQSGIPA